MSDKKQTTTFQKKNSQRKIKEKAMEQQKKVEEDSDSVNSVDNKEETQPEMVKEPVFEEKLAAFREDLLVQMQTLSAVFGKLKHLEQYLRKLEVEYKKEKKMSLKNKKRSRNLNADGTKGPVKPYGFNKPRPISPELAEFFGMNSDVLITSPQAVKLVSQYIREHQLANPENKKVFLPDEKLKAVFGEPRFKINKQTDELGYSYLNMQNYLSPHFHKSESS